MEFEYKRNAYEKKDFTTGGRLGITWKNTIVNTKANAFVEKDQCLIVGG